MHFKPAVLALLGAASVEALPRKFNAAPAALRPREDGPAQTQTQVFTSGNVKSVCMVVTETPEQGQGTQPAPTTEPETKPKSSTLATKTSTGDASICTLEFTDKDKAKDA